MGDIVEPVSGLACFSGHGRPNAAARKRAAEGKLAASQAQHEAVTAQFSESLAEKQRQVAALEHQLKLLLQWIKGSRQERVDPDQLLLFSPDELQEMAEQMGLGRPEEEWIDERPEVRRRKSRGRVGQLPQHLQREIIRHELPAEERICPCCGEERQEIGVG